MRESSKKANTTDKVRRKKRFMAYYWFIYLFKIKPIICILKARYSTLMELLLRDIS